MKKTILLTVIIASFMNLAAQQADYIIRNGKLIDGSGNNWQYKDVAIQNNKIVAIGNLKNWKATKEIESHTNPRSLVYRPIEVYKSFD